MSARESPARQRVARGLAARAGSAGASRERLARDGALEVVEAIQGDGGVAGAFTADATVERQVANLVAAVAGTRGPVDVLALNATGPQPEAPVEELTWEDHVAQLEFFGKSPPLLGRAVRNSHTHEASSSAARRRA